MIMKHCIIQYSLPYGPPIITHHCASIGIIHLFCKFPVVFPLDRDSKMYRIPGIKSTRMRGKTTDDLTSEDRILLALELFRNSDNEQWREWTTVKGQPEHYLSDPYDPTLPEEMRSKYEKSNELEHAIPMIEGSDDEDRWSHSESSSSNTQSPLEDVHRGGFRINGFLKDIADAVFGPNEVPMAQYVEKEEPQRCSVTVEDRWSADRTVIGMLSP